MPDDLPLYDSADGEPRMKLPSRPPSDARVTDYRVMPWPDGARVTVEMGLTPFKEFPSIDVSILNEHGDVLALSSLVGSMELRPAPTMWLPRDLPKATSLYALIEVLGESEPVQSVRVSFASAGPIVKAAVS
jgi:hypothetical protein